MRLDLIFGMRPDLIFGLRLDLILGPRLDLMFGLRLGLILGMREGVPRRDDLDEQLHPKSVRQRPDRVQECIPLPNPAVELLGTTAVHVPDGPALFLCIAFGD